MAKTLSSQQPTVTSTHNSKARGDAILEGLAETWEIDRKIEEIIAEEIADLRERKSEIKKKLREAYQITAPLFQARYQAYKLEQKAISGEDNATLDAIREMFELAPVGGQVNMLDAMDEKTADGSPKTDKDGFVKDAGDEAKAYQIGYDLGLKGGTLDATRYTGRGLKRLRTSFESGWMDAQAELVKGKKPEAAAPEAPPAEATKH